MDRLIAATPVKWFTIGIMKSLRIVDAFCSATVAILFRSSGLIRATPPDWFLTPDASFSSISFLVDGLTIVINPPGQCLKFQVELTL